MERNTTATVYHGGGEESRMKLLEIHKIYSDLTNLFCEHEALKEENQRLKAEIARLSAQLPKKWTESQNMWQDCVEKKEETA
jgi:uncharacterized small protein (DUF1192 family)